MRRSTSLGAFAAALLASGAAAAPGATVTAVTGSSVAGGIALERQARLADGDSIRTGEDGACSLLVDEDAVLEVCPGTSLRLGRRDGGQGEPRVLELHRGEIRVLAPPRGAGARIEVHTPAAIATVQGSVAYVAVDAKGTTTIASAENGVRVESARRLGSTLTLAAGQQVTLRPGAALPRKAERWDPTRSPADGCLVDFRALAFEAARPRGDARALEAITGQDVVDALPAVAAGRQGRREPPAPGLWIDPKHQRVLDVIDTGAASPP